jgi:hypothetical protein
MAFDFLCRRDVLPVGIGHNHAVKSVVDRHRVLISELGCACGDPYVYGLYSGIQLAKPLTRPVDTTGNEDVRLLFSVGMTLSD